MLQMKSMPCHEQESGTVAIANKLIKIKLKADVFSFCAFSA
jgi:hypothetical protein